MTATTLFKPCGIGNFEWLRLDGTQSEAASCAVGDIERLAQETGEDTVIFIAPAEKVSLRDARFDPAERKLLRQTLPYALEEELAEDVDELHFALGESTDNTVEVAVVRKALLAEWQQDLPQQEIDVQAVVPELQLLPLQDHAWTLFIREDCWLLRYGNGKGFAIEPEAAPLALQLLLDEAEQLPQRLLVFAAGQDHARIQSQLPELLRGVIDWRNEDYWAMIAQGFRQTAQPINLLQGEFARGLPWKKWWRLWKIVAVFLIAAIVINTVLSFARIQVLENRNIELRAETERLYRSVVPKGAIMQPAQQLRRKVTAMRSSGGEGFVSMFERTAKVLQAVEGLELQSINYNQKQTEIMVTIIANGFNDVETARANLEKAGFEAKLTGSNTEGDKTRARLRVRG